MSQKTRISLIEGGYIWGNTARASRSSTNVGRGQQLYILLRPDAPPQHC
jgi:hypothetical protein